MLSRLSDDERACEKKRPFIAKPSNRLKMSTELGYNFFGQAGGKECRLPLKVLKSLTEKIYTFSANAETQLMHHMRHTIYVWALSLQWFILILECFSTVACKLYVVKTVKLPYISN